MTDWIKDLTYATFISVVVLILLTYLYSSFTDTPIFKSGPLLIIASVLIALITVGELGGKGRVEVIDIVKVFLIIVILVGIFFVTKHYIPGIYNIYPSEFKDAFSIIIP